jgi:hypothetical protein
MFDNYNFTELNLQLIFFNIKKKEAPWGLRKRIDEYKGTNKAET